MSAIERSTNCEIRTILEKQRAAFQAREPYSFEERCELLDRAIGLLVEHEQEIIDALTADFGHRSPGFSKGSEVLSPLATLKQTKAELASWMRPEQRQARAGEAWVQYQPLGVVGIVTAWNVPGYMVFSGLAGALAAGNRVMIKPSEYNPQTSALIARLIRSVYAEEEVAVILGDAQVGQAFCGLPFDHLLFTGATSIGKHVLRAAAENLVPVTLELGGKSPTIISRSADFNDAVAKVVIGKLLNAGQLCVAPDHVFVPQESVDAFIAVAKAVVAKCFPTLRDNPDYTSIINARHFERLQGYLSEARSAGVELIELNAAAEDFSQSTLNKIVPTLLRNPGDDLQVMQDEIFGPLLPIKPYETLDEVIAQINARPRPLALYYFGKDASEEAQVLTRTCSGGVTLNGVMSHASTEGLPFGGVGQSGMGAYHGIDGFRTFSHAKAVLRTANPA
ncbi:coniferyl-aldehyde dehydrogenase [Pseudomonas laurylsulfativorans]|uniref:coniferyl aldehyde dehydrogenase n=1 Tax=Pseudomonas laurylsulfativorans TaxID=1943631 RepID=UPI00209D13AB|nr:coniferyl aldehyde dehydrogenase [Pseudomonas laurylsulfativorans]MCP1419585.1 coniferyl-aldehyde dehydrogenase [Pseudomonas laurylsulfativorans]